MLQIQEYDNNRNYRTLVNEPQIFHKALQYVLKGEKRFHVQNEGVQDFDLVYTDNDIQAKNDASFPDSDFYREEMIFPPYYCYDENDLDKINLYLLDGFEEIFFEDTNEYTIAIAMLVLKNTSLAVRFKDINILLFPWLKPQVTIGDKPLSENAIYVQKSFYANIVSTDRFSSLGLFHSLFIFQWLTDLPIKQIKYLELSIRKTEGIGSILSSYNKAKQALQRHNIKVFLEPGCTRYRQSTFSKYFSIEEEPEDMNANDTIYVKSFNCFVLTSFMDRHEANIDLKILNPVFVEQMHEYADEVIGNKKVLGVLLRGTDVIVANYVGIFRPANIEDCIRFIDERVKQYKYDKIFLATEDDYYLERMRAAFPEKIIAIAQERHTKEEFKQVKYISELEKMQSSDESYYNSVEDNLVNYIYAMFMLSRCESLLANCMCNGVNLASAFNEGKYIRKEIVSAML